MMLLPYILVRLITIPVAFEEWGSFGVRSKIWSEALNLINQNHEFNNATNQPWSYTNLYVFQEEWIYNF